MMLFAYAEAKSISATDEGAYIFSLSANDAGVVELIEPLANSCAGIYSLKISITNYGSDTLRSVDVKWTAQNVAQTTFKWTGTLLSNESDTFIIGTFNFLNVLNPKFVFWTFLPNGQTDGVSSNDSLVLNRSMRSLPTANAGADVDVCIGESVQLGPTALNGFSYKWTDLNNNIVSNSSKVIVSPTVGTTYVLEVTNTTFGCKRSDTVTVNVKSLPVVNAGSDAKVCYGSSTQIGENKVNGFNYQWSSIPSGFSATNSKVNVQPTVTTKYVLRKVDSLSNCLNRDTVEVQVVLPPITSINGVNTVCETFTQSYTAPNVSGDNYNWTLNGGGTIQSGQGSNDIAIKWSTPGNYNVKVIQTNTDGCKDTANLNVLVNRKPKAVFNVSSVCQGFNTDFINTSNDANSYFWYFGDNNNSSTQSPTHQYDSSGVYDVKLIAIGNNCYDTLVKQTTVYPLPVANFASTKTAGKKYAFTDNSNISSGTITSWEWNFGDGGSDNTQNPTYSYALVGNYNVQLCVTSSNGCKDCFSKFTEVTSINMLTTDSKIKVMPNPGNGIFEVNGEQNLDQIVVLNSLGQEVMSVQVNGNLQVIDLSELADGVYVFRVQYGDTWSLVRVVKQN
ncbi:MAG TPA: PKD domain-containing protein [Bacteroidia bacterium]